MEQERQPEWMENTNCEKCQAPMVRCGVDKDDTGLVKWTKCSRCGHKQRVSFN